MFTHDPIGRSRVPDVLGCAGGLGLLLGPILPWMSGFGASWNAFERTLPWVLTGRAWVHHHLVAEHNHARREAVSVALTEDTHLMDALPEAQRRELARLFKRLGEGSDGEAHESLERALAEVFVVSPGRAGRTTD